MATSQGCREAFNVCSEIRYAVQKFRNEHLDLLDEFGKTDDVVGCIVGDLNYLCSRFYGLSEALKKEGK
jgi:hypothetical protein